MMDLVKIVAFGLAFALINAEASTNTTKLRKFTRKSYVCPPHFVRLSHRCYYFSKEEATWQDAYYQCRDLHSNLAIIKNANQDKLIRRTLSKESPTRIPSERWLGGRYDWEQMTWKWGASGKPVTYDGFWKMETQDKERLQWHCIIIDPTLQFKWNTRSCLEKKQYICHTKIKTVTNKGKNKLKRQYNVNTQNQLNEIPVPYLPEDGNNDASELKGHRLNDSPGAEYALRRKPKKKRARKDRKRNRLSEMSSNRLRMNDNNTTYGSSDRTRRQKGREENEVNNMKFKWNTYRKNSTNPLAPRTIVEEFAYIKDAK